MPDSSATGHPLSAYTTLRLGGPPRRMITAVTAEEIVAGVREAAFASEPTLVLAGGSNVIVSDEGFAGTVILLRSGGMTAVPSPSFVDVTVDAGMSWDELVATAVDAGWSGLECLSGVPGSSGATPIQNVGAYGQEVAETITSVQAYDRVTDEVVTMTPADCGFGYRTSVFKYSGRWVVLSVSFRLKRSPASAPVRYAELARALGVPLGETAPLPVVRDAVLRLRASKGMVLADGDPDTYSAGSFFTNPVLDEPAYQAMVDSCGAAPPSWPGADGTVKVSAAWLIESTGFAKGYGHGNGVGISAKHTLALTNRGTGTTQALLDLAREIRDGVRERFGVTLHPEPVLVPPATL